MPIFEIWQRIYLESKIFEKDLEFEEEHTYIASLQLNDDHICSSVLFQEGFLLTTGPCAISMFNGIIKQNKTGNALFRNSNSRTWQKSEILRVAYLSEEKAEDYNIGVVMVSSLKSFPLWLYK